MLDRALAAAYARLGTRYPTVYVTIALQASWPIAFGTVGFIALYVDLTASELATFSAATAAVTGAAIAVTVWRAHRLLRPVREWIAGERNTQASLSAWRCAVGLPLALWRRGWFLHPILFAVLPVALVAGALTGDWWEASFVFAVTFVAMGYAGILNFFVAETGMRPVLVDIGPHLPAGFEFAGAAIPLRLKLLGLLPAINLISGLLAVGLSASDRDVAALGLDAFAAIVATFAASLLLTLLLARSLRGPLRTILAATHGVRDGRLDVSVPVTTSDEVGELADAFNEMVAGLAEREKMRATLGTYLDPSVAERLVSERPASKGEEVDATVLALDVRGFTAFAEAHTPAAVVAALNRLFDEAVPVIVAHGGTVDKFVGDGLLAVFGVPERQRDHAERGVNAALELTERLSDLPDCELEVGLGISSGRMLVGNIGGGGRLDFSVIGDAVNLAIRIEEATRDSDDAILVSGQTIDLLDSPPDWIQKRERIQVKGRRRPVRVWGFPRRRPAPAQ